MVTGFRALAAFCSLALVMSAGCANSSGSSSDSGVTPLVDSSPKGGSAIVPETADDTAINEEATCTVTFGEKGASVYGKGASASGGRVTITAAGIYELTGECADGQIIIDADKEDKVVLLLNGIKLTSSEGSVICAKKAQELVIFTAEGSENVLSDSENYTFEAEETEPDAAIYSKCDLILSGEGSLSVNGAYKCGIRGKDGLKICGGKLSVVAADDGIKAKDFIVAAGGEITVECGGDGVKATNSEDASLGYISISGGSFNITSAQDAFEAQTELIIDGGSITAQTGGGSGTVEYKSEGASWGGKFGFGGEGFDFDSLSSESGESAPGTKGLKAGVSVTINGGEFTLDCADDTIHSDKNVLISGGEFKLSSGDDAIHASENVTINGGTIHIVTCYVGIESSGIDINGGTIDLYAFDDGFNASSSTSDKDGYLCISDGSITINADGDGIDSNGTMAMSGGKVVVFGPTSNNNGAIDYQSSFAVSGGTLIALGSDGMAQAPSTLSQPCISVIGDVSADSTIEVRDAEDNVILSVETPKACRSLIFACESFVSGEEYTVYAAGKVLETVTAGDGVSGSGAKAQGGFGGGIRGNRWDIAETPDGMPRPEKPQDMPENFDPENLPEDFDPTKKPNGFFGRGGEQPADASST